MTLKRIRTSYLSEQILYYRGPQPPGRDPLPGRGRIPTGSRESSGENVYRYDALLFIVRKLFF